MISFSSWLKSQTYRNDLIGALACEAAQDSGWPETGEFQDFRLHLEVAGYCAEAFGALDTAWGEWRCREAYLSGFEAGRESAIFATQAYFENREVFTDLSLSAFQKSSNLPAWFIEWLDRHCPRRQTKRRQPAANTQTERRPIPDADPENHSNSQARTR